MRTFKFTGPDPLQLQQLMIRKTPTRPERVRQWRCYELSQTVRDVALMRGQRQSLARRRQDQDGKVSDQQEGNSSELLLLEPVLH